MNVDELKSNAVKLYGEGHSARGYIRLLAKDVGMSEGGMTKVWYGQRKIRGSVPILINVLVKVKEKGDALAEFPDHREASPPA